MADTLMYLKKLEDAGFSRKQAEAQVELMRDYSNDTLATKQDTKDLKQEIVELRNEMRAEFKIVRLEMAQMSDRLTIRIGGMMFVAMGLLAAYLKLG